MATELPRLTTLAQFKTALERTEAARQQLARELEAAQLKATLQQEQLGELQTGTQAELTRLRQETAALVKQVRSAQAATEQAQADKALAQAQAGQQLSVANELLSRMKLEAAAMADREVKREKELATLRRQLQQAQALREGESDTQDQLTRLRKQVDGLVAENRLMAQARDQLSQDQQALAATVEGHRAALTKAVAQAQAESRQQASLEIGRLQESLRLGQERLAALTAQLQSSGKLEVLAPDQVGGLMSSFLKQVEGGIPSLKLAEGELKLKMGLARSGPTQGFVILQPGVQADAASTVHEVTLKFDRAGTLPTLPSKP